MIFYNLNSKTYLMNNHYNKELRDRARALRNNTVSRAERYLWKKALSRKQLGVGFKRQRSIGNYIVDFFSAEVLLIVEIDGNSHYHKSEYDRIRHDWLEKQGYVVLRFSESEVLNNYKSVEEQLIHTILCLSKSKY